MIETIVNNYLLLVLIIGFYILSSGELKVDKERNKKIRILLLLVIIITTSSVSEGYFSNLDYYNFPRLFLSFFNYSLRPFIIVLFISIVIKERKKEINALYIIAIINCLIYSTCFYSGIAFSFTSANGFQRGILGYSCHISCLIYLLNIIYIIAVRFKKTNGLHTVLLIFITLSVLGGAILDFLEYHTTIFDSTMLVCILLYYTYTYIENTKIDLLTGLYNRKKLFKDFESINKITSVISIDMNDLKELNDTKGHSKGDIALATIGEIFKKYTTRNIQFYRVGGDEFVTLCTNTSEKQVKDLINSIKDDLSKTPYTCSFGYKMKEYEDVLETYKLADQKMYVEKRKYHKKKEK